MSPIFQLSSLLLLISTPTFGLFFPPKHATRPQAEYSTLSKCPEPGDQSKLPQNGIYLSPKPHEVWKWNEQKRITFCSGRFHEESSIFYDYLITSENKDVYYIQKPGPNSKKVSDFNATLPILDANSRTNGYEAGSYTLVIQEKHTSYGGAADASTVTFIPITIEA